MPTSRWDVSLWDVAKWDEVSDDLTADDVQSTSEVTAASIGQGHALAANNAESASEITSPALAQHHALSAGDVESASVGGAPNVGQAHTLAADDIESASAVTAPSIGQDHELGASDTEAQSEITSPAIGQGFETEPEINPTGIGAVADFRGEEKNRRAQDERERASKDDLTRIIKEAFDGKPEPETKQVPKKDPEKAKQPQKPPPAARPIPGPALGDAAVARPDFSQTILRLRDGAAKRATLQEKLERDRLEMEFAAYEAEQKALNDQQALELLLLVA